MMAGDIARVARAALEQGEAGLAQYDIQLFRPIQPMLAQSADDIPEALACIGEAALEYKMDGARVQVHKSGDDVVVYSRSLKDVTPAVPEVVEAGARASGQGSDPGRRSDQPAARRPAAAISNHDAALRAQAGRRAHAAGAAHDAVLVRSALPRTAVRFSTSRKPGVSPRSPNSRRESSDPAHRHRRRRRPRDEFLEQALARGHEGIMAKAIDAKYAAGARGQSWVKVKRARTLDLVILAAEWGNGRRKGWLSNLHLGARDTEKGGFAMLGKTFKGLTDEMLAWQTQELLKPRNRPRQLHRVREAGTGGRDRVQ